MYVHVYQATPSNQAFTQAVKVKPKFLNKDDNIKSICVNIPFQSLMRTAMRGLNMNRNVWTAVHRIVNPCGSVST